jgi:hypothetical protein
MEFLISRWVFADNTGRASEVILSDKGLGQLFSECFACMWNLHPIVVRLLKMSLAKDADLGMLHKMRLGSNQYLSIKLPHPAGDRH